MKKLNYLVTGGAGFIGSNLVERLVADGHSVRVLDDFSTGRRQNLAGFEATSEGGFELHEASIVDAEACARACAGMDYVLHQAAVPSVARSVADPATSHAACATGTLNMLKASADAGVKRFVYAGSSSAYGDTPTLPKREDMTSSPRSPYAVAKLTGEHYCQVFPRLFGLETVVIRYFNIFGPRQDPGSPYSAVIPLFIDAALDGRTPRIDGDGGQTRDFTYIDNAVNANLLACTAPAESASGEVFNVGCGDRISILDLWTIIREQVGSDVDAEHGPPRPGDVRDSLADLTKIRAGLGYEVLVSLEDGLRKTTDWLREQRALASSA